MNDIHERIKRFEAQTKNITIAYGGDGTLLNVFHQKPDKAIIPVRDYGQCDKHKTLIDKLLSPDEKFDRKDSSLKLSTHDLIELDGKEALSEVQIINANPSQCLRMDIRINRQMFMENVIANGIIASTTLGASGYFKSVARTLFRDGFGLAFICPTYGINNIVLKPTDIIDVVFKRNAKVNIAWDTIVEESYVEQNMTKTISLSSNRATLIGYDIFMCSECRKGRNSTLVNDKYEIFE